MSDESFETGIPDVPHDHEDLEFVPEDDGPPPQNLAVATRDTSRAVGKAMDPADIPARAPVTAAQAKVEAVAALTMKAYERAATLQLTKEESDQLLADFPDEAFKPGAAGKENLIYIEHAFLRDRLSKVFGIGQWSIVPRNRWAEDFMTKGSRDKPPTAGVRVYVEAMLVIRGCFVGEAVGSMDYYPSNGQQDYSDAVEGAKTAALRRCAKELGIGLQAWKKDWCEGWWQRKRGAPQQRAPMPPTPRAQPRPAAQAPAPATLKEKTPTRTVFPTAKFRDAAIKALKADAEPLRKFVTEFLQKAGVLMPNNTIDEWPLRYVPATPEELAQVVKALQDFKAGEWAKFPFQHQEPGDPPKPKPAAAAKPIEVPRAPDAGDQSEAPTEIDPDWDKVGGTIERTSYKNGAKKNGEAWEMWGIKIGQDWFNTFSSRLGKLAEANKGREVDLYYSANERGKTAEHIEV